MAIAHLSCLLALACAFGPTGVAEKPVILLDAGTRQGRLVGTWGPSASASVSDRGVMRVSLGDSRRPNGAYLSLERGVDLSHTHRQLYLALDIRGEKGGEDIHLVLRDGSLDGGAAGYQTEANLPAGFVVTTRWQRLVLPLADFPDTGESWSRPVADPLAPPKRAIVWSKINNLGIGKWAGPVKVDVRGIVVTAHPEAASVRLVMFKPVATRLDLSHGASLSVSGVFDGPAPWRVRIGQWRASKTFTGLSNTASVVWDGASDTVPFAPGRCTIQLTYGADKRPAQAARFLLIRPHSPRVQVAQTGYEPHRRKTACVMHVNGRTRFRVVDAGSDAVVFSGVSGTPLLCNQAGDTGAILDFTPVQRPGKYYVDVDGVGRSYEFPVRRGVYNALCQTAMKSYYFQRCGVDLTARYAGKYARKACHTNDGFLYNGSRDDEVVPGEHVACNGGWHDAGDYGKKIVAASDALGYLLMACELFPAKAAKLRLGIPGDPAVPDILREIRVELDWMLTMQEADGGVHALITSPDFFLTDMPARDNQPRYLVAVSTCATGDFAAVMAKAARVYAHVDPAFALRCVRAARQAWRFLERNPEIVPAGGYHDPPGIHDTGTYYDAQDSDERFWAACELFVTTSEPEFDRYVHDHYAGLKPDLFQLPGFLYTQGFGLYSYVLSGKGDSDVTDVFKKAILAYATAAADAIERSPYGIAVAVSPYWWNNCTALQSSVALIVADLIAHDSRFSDGALRQIGYVLGCNPVDRCYVTGVGSRPVMDPWQPACVFDGIADPIPGFVLPGANLKAWDLPMQRYQEVHRLPPLKNYSDDHRAASVNEVCLNYNGPFVFVSAFFAQ